jgi:hypothetical protein
MSDPGIALGVGLVVAGSLAVAAGRRLVERRRARRELRGRPPLGTTTPEGVAVRVVGIVRALDTTLTAPLSHRACVAYRARVEAPLGRLVLRGRRYETVAVERFAIDRDGATAIIVEASHAVFALKPTALAKGLREHQVSFAALHGVQRLKNVYFEEVVVEPGQRVSVAGLMMLDPAEAPADGELGFRDPAAPDVRLTGNRDHPIVIGTG